MSREEFARVSGMISHYYKRKLDFISKNKLPIRTLIAIAIEREFEREKPFQYEDISPPIDPYIQYEYADEAQKILQYLSASSGMSLEHLCLNRHDIGIPDKLMFMRAFRECLLGERLEIFSPRKTGNSDFRHHDDTQWYRLKPETKAEKKKRERANKGIC